jgi:trimethylamine--corrinoid protein Co-methyltransferase
LGQLNTLSNQKREELMDKLEKIHDTSLRILKEIGIKLNHPEVLDIVKQKGIEVSETTAFFQPEQVMEWVNKAPPEFTLHARNPTYNIVIGGNHRECAAGYGCSTIIEADGQRRDAVLEDYVTFAKLVHQTSHFNINGGILAQPSDIDPQESHLVMLYGALTHSDKCILGVPGSGNKVEQVMEMMAIVFGGERALMEKPRVLTLVNPISPLHIDETGLQSILVAARHHQPLIISPAPAAGMTGPVSLAGNIALGVAEALAGIAICQMIVEGTPVIFGLQPFGADLRTGSVSIGSPMYAIQVGYCAELARMYGLPSRGGGTANDAKSVSAQSGYESMLSMLASFQKGINLIIHSAGILDSFAGMSYEQFVVDLEIISMIKFYLQDIEVGEESLSFEVIKEVGPGGQFLATDDTFDKFLTHSWNPEISLRGNLAGKTPDHELRKNIDRKLQEMLDSYEKPDLDDGIRKELERYLIDAGVDRAVVEKVADE